MSDPLPPAMKSAPQQFGTAMNPDFILSLYQPAGHSQPDVEAPNPNGNPQPVVAAAAAVGPPPPPSFNTRRLDYPCLKVVDATQTIINKESARASMTRGEAASLGLLFGIYFTLIWYTIILTVQYFNCKFSLFK